MKGYFIDVIVVLITIVGIYNTSEYCFSHDLIGSSISEYQVLFTSRRLPEKKGRANPI